MSECFFFFYCKMKNPNHKRKSSDRRKGLSFWETRTLLKKGFKPREITRDLEAFLSLNNGRNSSFIPNS